MHHRPTRRLPAALRALAGRCTERLAHRSGRLLVLTAVVALAAVAALAVPRSGGVLGTSAGSAQEAASTRQLPSSQIGTATSDPGAPGEAAARPGADAGAGDADEAADGADEAAHGADVDGGDADAAGSEDAVAETADGAAAANPNCTLLVPDAPTTATGLATPYRLTATDRAAGPCHESDADQSAFVEAAVYDPATHAVSIYHPLVIDRRDRPAQPPVPVTLPTGAVVGVWFGFNGDTLTLAGPGAGSCVNGLPGSPFGQFAYCNAAAFFGAANGDATLQAAIPAIGTATDGRPCPTTRDFAVVDQDQSDNLATAYRVIGGRMAQLTPATATRGTALTNGSDEGLLANAIDPALGCRPFTAPDLTNGGAPTAALALNELSAAQGQVAPAALVPVSDPMVLVDGRRSVDKTDLYRAGVDQPALPTGQTPREYCAELTRTAPARLALDAAALRRAPAPADDQPDLLAFLRDRFTNTLQELGCPQAPVATDPAPAAATSPAATSAAATSAAATSAAPSPTTRDHGTASPTTSATAAPSTSAPAATPPASSSPASSVPVSTADPRDGHRPRSSSAPASPTE